jgi:hypothetical protein
MNHRKLVGIATVTISITLLITYTYLLFLAKPDVQVMVVKLTVYVIVVLLTVLFTLIGFGLLNLPLFLQVGNGMKTPSVVKIDLIISPCMLVYKLTT